MKQNSKKIHGLVVTSLFVMLLASFNVYSINTTDKAGRPIVEIEHPTAEHKPPEDTITDAVRKTVNIVNEEKYRDPIQNIHSENIVEGNNIPAFQDYIKTLYDNKMIETLIAYGELTEIRYTVSITDVDTDRYELINDSLRDRLKMKIIVENVGEFFAKDGFYKVNGKTYYFDENGYMVLGPARDKKNNYYFFSYETGELIE